MSRAGEKNTVSFGVIWPLCVPKTSAALIRGKNRLTSADHDRASLLHLVGVASENFIHLTRGWWRIRT